MTTRGRFITLEGGEGAGKSTQARFIRDWLVERGREVVLTREPGGSPLAEAIRSLVLGDWAEGVTPPTEVMLMFAARAAHWHTTIEPALAAGRDVVCDRFVDSSYAYQGAGKGVDETALQVLERLAVGSHKPDLTLLFDIEPALGLQRTRERGEENRFEQETLEFMQRVRESFVARARAEPARFAMIDAACDADAVSASVAQVLVARLAPVPETAA
ncbi:dTMP kinase [Solimonas variicoloris]|uniref:dTMP kinase n=1 Tax=Solimonas variicoloris TaxID=254408 RepID=UPI000380F694|nr:dTMP kinase [Solimonas variicoloris]